MESLSPEKLRTSGDEDDEKELAPDTLRGPLADWLRSLKEPFKPGDIVPPEIIDQARIARLSRVGDEK
jgi:hypothetical protein